MASPVADQRGDRSLARFSGLQAGEYFTLSEDRKDLLYTRESTFSNLWLASFGGTNGNQELKTTPLTTGTLLHTRPKVSPDGSLVAFSRGDGQKSNIFSTPLEGGPIQQLTFFDSRNESPGWSPDGKEIAFVSTEDGTSRVWRVSATSGAPHPYGRTPAGPNMVLEWSPGKNILYQTVGNRNFRILDPVGNRESYSSRTIPWDGYSNRAIRQTVIELLRHGIIARLGAYPMLLRFCGLRRLPSRPTIVNWLKQFTGERLKGLSELNGVLVHEQIERLGLNRLTVDMDGTVVQAGNQVGWAFRGFNPHRKKNKSFYPLFAHLAQTGQILKSRNRPGNVHDSKGADAFLRELIGELRGQCGRSRKLEFRTDAAFFNEKILKRLERSRSEFAIKAPFWPWLGLKEVVAGRKRWHRVSDEIDGFSIKYFIEPWNITVRIAIYRKRVRHRTAKNFQLDLFSPDDGYFEYSAVATNKSLTVQRLWYFAAGRGGQEKTFAELRSQFALDVVPTKSYAANSAWQQLNVLAHNLCRSFQLDTIAETKGFSRKRTCTHLLNTIRTIRFRIFNKAGRLVRVSGRNALRMATNSSTQTLFERIELALAS